MKKSIYLGIALVVFISCKSTQNTPNKQVESYEVSEAIQQSLNYLASDSLKGRKTGTKGIEKAAQYIENTFQEAGIKPYFKTYRDHFLVADSISAYNIVGFIEGNDPELKNQLIILGAHYDHVGIIKPVAGDSIANGANDNAAGTVAILEIAKHFASKNPKRSIVFALFSAEEMGLLGSKHLAKKLKKEQADIYVMLNFEMIGVPLVGKPYLAYLTGFNKSNLAEKFNEYTGKKVFGFLEQAKKLKLFYRSDNHPFYDTFHIPAQTLCTFDFTNYPYYHHVEDEAHLMNIDHMKNLILSVIPGIKKMANTPEKEIAMKKKLNK